MSSSNSGRYGGKKDEDLALFQHMLLRGEQQQQHSALLHSEEDGIASRPGSSHSSSSSSRARRQGSNDLLISDMMESKNDYDWLLTPPGTPLFPSLDRDLLTSTTPPSSRKPSRLSAGCESSQPRALDTSLVSTSSTASSSSSGRPNAARHPSPSARGRINSNSSSSGHSNSINGSNVGGARRASTPTRSSPSPSCPPAVSAGRQSTPSSWGGRTVGGAVASRPSTPTRAMTSSVCSGRPSTPTQRARSSTPTGRRPMTPPLSGSSSNSSGTGVVPASRASRGTSPMRQPQQRRSDPAPGLRTTAERPLSASRCATIPSSATRPSFSNGGSSVVDPRRLNRSYNSNSSPAASLVSDREIGGGRAVTPANDGLPLRTLADDKSTSSAKKSTRLAGSRETSFYGTSISKKSLDTAIRHMDIRRSSPSGFRPLVANTHVPSYPKFSPPIASRATSRSSSMSSSSSSSNGWHKAAASNGGASEQEHCHGSGSSMSNGSSYKQRNELDMFTAAADGVVDNFLLDSDGLDDLNTCNNEARKAEVARELQILEQQCGHRFADSST